MEGPAPPPASIESWASGTDCTDDVNQNARTSGGGYVAKSPRRPRPSDGRGVEGRALRLARGQNDNRSARMTALMISEGLPEGPYPCRSSPTTPRHPYRPGQGRSKRNAWKGKVK